MENNINKFNELAKEALAMTIQGKASREGSKTLQSELSFFVMKIFIAGKIQEAQHVRKAFSKEGPYNAIRMVMTRANAVALHLVEKGEVPVTTKEGTSTFTLAQVKEASETIFNVSTAYKTIKADKEPALVNSDDDAINAFLERSGYDRKAFNDQCKLQPEFKEEALTQGRIILEEQAREEMLNNVPAIVEAINTSLNRLKDIAPEVYDNLIASHNPASRKQAKAA